MVNIMKGTSGDNGSSGRDDLLSKKSMLKKEKKTSLAKKSISMVNIMKGSSTAAGPAGSPEQKSAPVSGGGFALGGGGMLKGKSAAADVQSLSAPGFGFGGGGMTKGKQTAGASKKGFGKSVFGGGGMLKGKAAGSKGFGSSSPGFVGGMAAGGLEQTRVSSTSPLPPAAAASSQTTVQSSTPPPLPIIPAQPAAGAAASPISPAAEGFPSQQQQQTSSVNEQVQQQQQQVNENRAIPPSFGQSVGQFGTASARDPATRLGSQASFGNALNNMDSVTSSESSRPDPQNNARIIGGPSATSGGASAVGAGVDDRKQQTPLSVTVIDPRTGKKRTISVSTNPNNSGES